jgi:hypothetical protein
MRLKVFHQLTVSYYPLWIGILCLIATPGCNKGGVKCYPVHGSVVVNGQPADGVRVIFCPVSPMPPEMQKKLPAGLTNSEGKFSLTTFEKDDGAPEGEYKVTAQWYGNTTDKFGRPAVGDTDKFNNRFTDPQKSEIKATVKGSTDLPPFDFKLK